MYFESSENKNSPIICNVPHGGVLIPYEFVSDFSLSKDELEQEVKYMADNYTDNLFSELINISSFIKSKISRVVLDIERFKEEENEPMSKVGMSALYTKTSNGKILRNISYIPEYVSRAVDCLWELVKKDRRDTNPYSDHPLRILQEIIAVRPNKSKDYSDIVIDKMMDYLDHFDPK